ncbi:MAG: MBL fold metallo-hydrolase [bacterium]
MIAAALLAAVALGLVALWWIGRPRGVGQSGDLRLHLIAPDVWMFRGYFSNAFALILPTRVVVIDALISPETAAIFRDALARVTRLPITHIIWTHYNGDHVGGTSALAGPGVEIICTEETARLVVERDDERRAYVEAFGLIAHDYPVVPAPTRTFSGTLRLELDGEVLELRQLGAVETSDACVVWWPARQVIAVGDGVSTAGYPFTGAPVADEGLRDDGAWIGFLERVEALAPDVLLAGHGPALEGQAIIAARLALLRALMADVVEAARAERAQGGSVVEIAARAEARLTRYARHPDLRQNVSTQRFALFRALNSLDPERRGRGWWWDFRPSLLADPPAAEVDAACAAHPTPASARAAAASLPPAVGRALLLARGGDEAASHGRLAEVMLAAVTTPPSIIDAADYFREAARAAHAALAQDARQPEGLLVLGILEVWARSSWASRWCAGRGCSRTR